MLTAGYLVSRKNGYAMETEISFVGVGHFSLSTDFTIKVKLQLHLSLSLLMFVFVFDILLQLGFKMFLGFSPVITNWSAASDEFSLILDNNPMAEFAELPEGHEGLLFSNILCGVLRGALEMVRLLAGIKMLTQKNQLLLHKQMEMKTKFK